MPLACAWTLVINDHLQQWELLKSMDMGMGTVTAVLINGFPDKVSDARKPRTRGRLQSSASSFASAKKAGA